MNKLLFNHKSIQKKSQTIRTYYESCIFGEVNIGVLVSASKDGVPVANVESIDQNQAYNISAALTYTTQLVNVIAFYLGIKLPNKLCYR